MAAAYLAVLVHRVVAWFVTVLPYRRSYRCWFLYDPAEQGYDVTGLSRSVTHDPLEDIVYSPALPDEIYDFLIDVVRIRTKPRWHPAHQLVRVWRYWHWFPFRAYLR